MNNKDRFEEKCYRAYQLDWMLSHGYGFNDLFEIIVGLAMEAVEETPMASATNGNSVRNLAECAAEEFWTEAGFDGRLYACKEEFLGAEYKDAGYMKHLTSMMPDPEKQYASWRKYSGTERVEDLEIERVLTISTGHISQKTAEKLDMDDFDTYGFPVYPKGEYGWWIHIPQNMRRETLSKDLADCIDLAVNNDCRWLCLDRDAGKTSLPAYEW